MKKTFITIILIAFSINGFSLKAQTEKKYDSLWEGSLNFGSQKLKIIIKIVTKEDGTKAAFLDSPDQGAVDIPATKVSITKGQFEICDFESRSYIRWEN